ESPSTASTTPDSTEGGNDESDFPELQTAREFSEDEEEASVEWGTPRELTFSYITIAGGPSSSPTMGEPGSRGRRDSQTRRTRPALPRTETCETFVPALGDSLENIPSLCPSPEGEGASPPGHGQGLDPFSGWDVETGSVDEPPVTEEGRGLDLYPQHSPTTEAAEWGRCRTSSSDTSSEELPRPDALTPPPAEGTSPGASAARHQTVTSLESHHHLVLEEEM
ncbi:PREDICTED: reticulon-2-like, partial [Gekko japonicus]|uniref:Reticulon-2-like n=1 Tax=Gekko japonicus TaxID=146911 RepID=A0ABM1KXB3_GEKJA